jgi:peptide/nickel transport system permease protein
VSGRLIGSFAALIGASLVAFVIMRILPGDPARLIVGPFATEDQVHQEYIALGLDKPIFEQYWLYVTAFVRGDWGFSYSAGEPVRLELAQRLPATVELAWYAFLFAFGAALVVAVASTYRRRRFADAMVSTSAFLGLGTPPFWIGLLLLLLLSGSAHILPGPEGRLTPQVPAPPAMTGLYTIDAAFAGQWDVELDAFRHLLLPAIVLGFAPYAYLVRILRANLFEVSREPFLVVVRSKGISRWNTYVVHALPNAILPTLTAAGLVLAHLIAGSVLIESVFDWPGVGQLVASSVFTKDFSVVQAFIILSVLAFVMVNAVVDILYGVIDPRLRANRIGSGTGVL